MEKGNRFYTIKEATDMLGISEQEVMNMITQKKLPAIKMEKSIRIREEDLEKILNSLGRKPLEEETAAENNWTIPIEEIEGNGEIKEEPGDEKTELERSYKELLKKKQELEEDINYLQYQYDEFKNKIKNLVSDEFKMFLKKIDEVNPVEGKEVLQNNFVNNLDIDEDEDLDKTAENQKDGSDDEEEALLLEDDE
ncbi:MAG TPA: helix-turn-helix domain-containing protein [Candidatus Humimicrobiaceae bacterium]